tara:strand:- start:1533 stop:1796 length:264 start_codon:yes stop_codon:yes gene_type:complete
MKPNLILISWKDWIPTYVRDEIENQLGAKVDGTGVLIEDKREKTTEPSKESTTKRSYKKIIDHKSIRLNNVYENSVIERLEKMNVKT